MGYYRRSDLAFYDALADAFTICDDYHCWVLGPTHPNQLMSLSGTIDPGGQAAGRRTLPRVQHLVNVAASLPHYPVPVDQSMPRQEPA